MKTGLLICCFICVSLGYLSGQQPCEDCPCLLAQAQKMERAGKYGDAIYLYQAYGICLPAKQKYASDQIANIQKQTNQARENALKAQRLSEESKKIAEEQADIAEEQRKIADEQRKKALEETAKTQKRLRTNHNLAKTLDVLQQNPTLALRMSEEILKNQPDDAGAQQLFNDIASNGDNFFYQKQLFSDHPTVADQLALSPDGSMLLSSHLDKTVCLWSTDGYLIKKFKDLPDRVVSPQFSQTGGRILVAGRSWVVTSDTAQYSTWVQSPRLPNGRFGAAAISPDGTRWVYGDLNGRLFMGDTLGQILDTVQTACNGIFQVVFSPLGNKVMASGPDSVAYIWEFGQQQQINFLRSEIGLISEVRFSPSGQTVLTVCSDSIIQIWGANGQLLKTLEETGQIKDIEFVNNDSIFVQTDARIVLRDINNTRARPFIQEPQQSYKAYLSLQQHRIINISVPKGKNTESPAFLRLFTTSGTYKTRFAVPSYFYSLSQRFPALVDVSPKNEIRLYYKNARGLVECLRFSNQQAEEIRLASPPVSATTNPLLDRTEFAFTPFNNILFLLPGDSALRMYDLKSRRLKEQKFQKSGCITTAFFINPQYKSLDSTQSFHILTLNSDSTATLWDRLRDRPTEINPIGKNLYAAAFSPDGLKVLEVFSDSTIWLWRSEDRRHLMIGKHPGVITCAAFSPDGQLIATAGTDHMVRLWSVAERREIRSLFMPGKGSLKFDFIPDVSTTRILVQSNDQEISLWDCRVFDKPLATWRGYWNSDNRRSWGNARLSPDGKYLLLSGKDGQRPTIAAVDGPEMIELEGKYAVKSSAFSSDGKTFLIGGDDNTAHLWNLTGTEIAHFPGHSGSIIEVACSPDNNQALTLDDKGIFRLWDLPSALLEKKVDKVSVDDLAASGFIPEPEDIDSITSPKALYHTAFSFFQQRDSVTAHTLLDRLIYSPYGKSQGEEVWYLWYLTGKAADHDHRDELMQGNFALFHPLAERFKRAGLYSEAKDLYEALLSGDSDDEFLLGDYFETCRLGGFKVNESRFLKAEKNPQKLYLYAKFFLSERDTATAAQLFVASFERKADADPLIGLLDCTSNPVERSRILQEYQPKITQAYELMQLAHQLRQRKYETEAIAIYESALTKQEIPEVMIDLYEISFQIPNYTFDTTRFLQSNSPDALRRYADYFDDHIQMKSALLERLAELGKADEYDLYDLYQVKKSAGIDILPQLESLKGSRMLFRLMTLFGGHGQSTPERTDKVDYYAIATRLGERLLQLPDGNTNSNKRDLTNFYNSLGWQQLFTGDYKGSEKAIRRGIELDSTYLYLYTNLPPALLFQGRFAEAKALYKEYESRPYFPERDRPFIRDAYLVDFEDFKSDFQFNPRTHFTPKMVADMDKIIAFLKGLPPNLVEYKLQKTAPKKQ